ncbi:MAG: hypothetical protein ACPK85_07565 [Methanosarcina sp.]
MDYAELLQKLVNLDDLQFIEEVQNIPMKSDAYRVTFWNALLLEMDKRRHDMYQERNQCKSHDEYKNNDLIDLYASVEWNKRNELNQILTKQETNKVSSVTKGKKPISDEIYLKEIKEHMEEYASNGISFWKVDVNDDLYEIDSSEYYELMEIGGYRLFRYP